MAWVLFVQQNTKKTANRNSRINFYFVTGFYSLYNICIADGKASESGIRSFFYLPKYLSAR